jgi:hypothetical protein
MEVPKKYKRDVSRIVFKPSCVTRTPKLTRIHVIDQNEQKIKKKLQNVSDISIEFQKVLAGFIKFK